MLYCVSQNGVIGLHFHLDILFQTNIVKVVQRTKVLRRKALRRRNSTNVRVCINSLPPLSPSLCALYTRIVFPCTLRIMDIG